MLLNLKSIRQLRGLTQHELARRLGRSQSFYNGIERGLRSVTDDEVDQIAQALDVSREALTSINSITVCGAPVQPRAMHVGSRT